MGDSNGEFPTTLGKDAVFKGQLRFEKGVRLLGSFEGEISSDGQLLVAEGATLTGDVKAGTVRIDGHVKGNMICKLKVQLTASARLEGDVQAQRLEVAEGAVLVGRCVIGVEGKASAPRDIKEASAPAASLTPGKAKSADRVPLGARK